MSGARGDTILGLGRITALGVFVAVGAVVVGGGVLAVRTRRGAGPKKGRAVV